MKVFLSSSAAAAAWFVLFPSLACAFVQTGSPSFGNSVRITSSTTTTTTTSLNAIGALAKKAKQAALRKYAEGGIEDAVKEQYSRLKQNLDKGNVDVSAASKSPGSLQQELTKRKGTITVIAEFKRKNDYVEGGIIKDVYDPEVLSPVFREYGASGIAVMADERMGGCSYADLAAFCEEQRRARNEVPGPVAVINNDLIVDELQIAQTAAAGAKAVVLALNVIGEEQQVTELLQASAALDLEAIVSVTTAEEAQTAIDLGARMLLVNVDGPEAKVEMIQGLNIPEGEQVCMIAQIIARKDRALQEIEETWAVRDKGFSCAWISDALYKGADNEHPGAIIKSMKSKSSLKWASPTASSGKGEGAREYLGDLLM